MTRFGSIALVMCAACACGVVSGQDLAAPRHGGKLLLTAGTSQIEGAAGAALTPWAVIGGYGTREQWGASAFHSELPLGAFRFQSSGALVGLRDRVELSIARQRLRPDAAGPALGQDVFGVKWRISGDAVFDQDRPWPQLALGVQHKRAERGALLRDLGARDAHGTDVYLAATKLYLDSGLLASGALRYTRANQFGLLGFGGPRGGARLQWEGSLAWLVHRRWAVGAEYRAKPDQLPGLPEDDAWDVFALWAPNKHFSLSFGLAELGRIGGEDRQRGTYVSAQIGY